MRDHGFRPVPVDPPYGRGYEHERFADILAMGPRGDKGDKGDAGPAGERGERGPVGPKGDKGDKGDVGEPGPRGPQGDRGPAGLDGSDGERGEQGPMGPAGPAGPKGDRGPDGPRGPQGERGPQGIMGPRGEKGDPGESGKDGRDGKTPIISAVQASDGYVIIVDGKPVARVVNGSDATATDVQINGTSITADGVANIPTLSRNNHGVAKVNANLGIYVNGSGELYVDDASQSRISARAYNAPVTGHNLDYAFRAAMTDGKGAAWTDAEKLAARERLGLGGDFELIEEVTLSQNEATFERYESPSGKPYKFKKVAVEVSGGTHDGASAWINLYVSKTSNVLVASCQINNPSYRLVLNADIDCGRVSGFGAGPGNGVASYTAPVYFISADALGIKDGINAVRLMVSASKLIKAGSKIKIYGVWA